MLDVEMLVFFAFIAYLAVLAAILFMSRKSSSPILLSYPQMQSEAKTEPPPKPKIYKHTITASPNIIKTQGLLKQLEEQGISYTLTKHEKANAKIEFKTDKVLQNIEELKKKGVILEAKIEEAKDNDPAVV
jgi:predicted nucleotide-binding protein (sugar kinase/HSP70/actin superfamily)